MNTLQNVSGWLHSVETAGTLDGPGIRYVVFLSGCPLRCQYCHNPDAQKMTKGTPKDSFELLKEIAPYRDFLNRANGGITISGGEPTCQAEFVKSVFEGCRRMGIHTALDTSGYLEKAFDEELLELTDLFLLDIKHFDPEQYKVVTGVKLEPTLRTAKKLAEHNKKIWLRYVLVPGLTDQIEHIQNLAEFVASLGVVERVEVLPFHKMGEYKWEALGMEYKLKDTQTPDEVSVDNAKACFSKYGLTVY